MAYVGLAKPAVATLKDENARHMKAHFSAGRRFRLIFRLSTRKALCMETIEKLSMTGNLNMQM